MSPFLWPLASVLASGLPFGGDEQNRTVDPLLARQVLSQLSYTPIYKGMPEGEFFSPPFLKVLCRAFKIKQRFKFSLSVYTVLIAPCN